MRDNGASEFSSNTVSCGYLYLAAIAAYCLLLIFFLIMLQDNRMNVALDFAVVFF